MITFETDYFVNFQRFLRWFSWMPTSQMWHKKNPSK